MKQRFSNCVAFPSCAVRPIAALLYRMGRNVYRIKNSLVIQLLFIYVRRTRGNEIAKSVVIFDEFIIVFVSARPWPSTLVH